ncbi:MAG: guanylate kinase [Candidatus Firestonebacteria bacterium RIFOXYA2_FULL_40_8]|nr:MAG: guanylate kinase [Candidatus Firestonebacteria bacterium RIFOXYA2_FULL_40_8]
MLNSKVFNSVIKNSFKATGLLVVISSPTAVGKTTVCKELVRRGKGLIVNSISATSRVPRKGEREGNDYFFVGRKFPELIKKNYFLEWEQVHESYYGTPKKYVEQEVSKDKAIILTIDVKGGATIRKKFENSVLIFLLPPSLEIMKKRLEKRGTETAAQIKVRLNSAVKELKYLKKYDYLVVNDRLEETVKTIESIILAERHRVCS